MKTRTNSTKEERLENELVNNRNTKNDWKIIAGNSTVKSWDKIFYLHLIKLCLKTLPLQFTE